MIENKINKLFDEEFVMKMFEEKVLPLYPDFVGIESIEIESHKKFIWEHTYHVVIEFKTEFISGSGERDVLPIFCSAHSDEERGNVYHSLEFLWENGFGGDELSIPHPLFYSEEFRGIFYRGVEGRNLYRYIREDDKDVIEEILPMIGKWFARLHSVPVEKAKNFNEVNSVIETVLPGVPHIMDRIRRDYPQYLNMFEEIYKILVNKENAYLNSTDVRCLVHGDAHPENVIRMSTEKIGVIDFTDLCLSDFARDLGTFVQQIEFMADRKINDPEYSEKLKNMFLDSYFENSRNEKTDEVMDRINNYYYWTMMRTITFFLLKADPEPERTEVLIEKICNELAIGYNKNVG